MIVGPSLEHDLPLEFPGEEHIHGDLRAGGANLRGRLLQIDGLLLVHHSIGNDAVPEVANLPIRKAVVYHNITPATYFAGLNDELMRYAEVGREQLKLLATTAELGIADSEYNRKELEEAGLTTTAVVPPLVDWEDFDRPPDQDVARRLADERTSILTVGQILPHKAVHDVIAALDRSKYVSLFQRLSDVIGLPPV